VDFDGKPVTLGEGPTCGFGAPAGCVWASADDVARLMKLLFTSARVPLSSEGTTDGDDDDDDDALVVDPDTVAEFLLPRVLLRDGLEAIGMPFEMQFIQPASPASSMPWMVSASDGDNVTGFWVMGKQGELDGYRSSMTCVLPSRLVGGLRLPVHPPYQVSASLAIRE
jgi:hypothetical protein